MVLPRNFYLCFACHISSSGAIRAYMKIFSIFPKINFAFLRCECIQQILTYVYLMSTTVLPWGFLLTLYLKSTVVQPSGFLPVTYLMSTAVLPTNSCLQYTSGVPWLTPVFSYCCIPHETVVLPSGILLTV